MKLISGQHWQIAGNLQAARSLQVLQQPSAPQQALPASQHALGQQLPDEAVSASLASAVSDEELWRQSCKILKDDSEQNFDAFWQTCDFVVEMGLDPAPLEAMVPQFRKDSRVPRGNIDTKAQELSEYRRLQGAEPFKAW